MKDIIPILFVVGNQSDATPAVVVDGICVKKESTFGVYSQ